jgi:hypothetical protein
MSNRLQGAVRTCVKYKKSKRGRPVCAKFRKTGKTSGVPSRRARKAGGVKSRRGAKATVSVSRAKATKRNGKLLKGCRFVGGKKVKCSPAVAKRLRGKKGASTTASKRRRGTKRAAPKATVSVSRAKATKSNGKLLKGCRYVGGKKVKCTPAVAKRVKGKKATKKKASTSASKRKGRAKGKSKAKATVPVQRCLAAKRSGRGLVKGCRPKKGDGSIALCTPAVAKRRKKLRCDGYRAGVKVAHTSASRKASTTASKRKGRRKGVSSSAFTVRIPVNQATRKDGKLRKDCRPDPLGMKGGYAQVALCKPSAVALIKANRRR